MARDGPRKIKSPLVFINTVYAAPYNEIYFEGLWVFRCTSVEVVFEASAIESQDFSFFIFIICVPAIPDLCSCI